MLAVVVADHPADALVDHSVSLGRVLVGTLKKIQAGAVMTSAVVNVILNSQCGCLTEHHQHRQARSQESL